MNRRFGKTFAKLLKQAGIPRKVAAKEMGTSEGALSSLINSNREIRPQTAKKAIQVISQIDPAMADRLRDEYIRDVYDALGGDSEFSPPAHTPELPQILDTLALYAQMDTDVHNLLVSLTSTLSKHPEIPQIADTPK